MKVAKPAPLLGELIERRDQILNPEPVKVQLAA
jgi:hypothetical protein